MLKILILKTLKYLFFFLVCLAVALVFTVPMQNVQPYIELPTGIEVSGVDGTIRSGSAAQVVIDDFPLNAVEYRYMPSCIPLLKICYRVEYNRGEMEVAYDLLNSDTEVHRTRIDYDTAELAGHFLALPAKPSGRTQVLIDEVSLIDGKPQILTGQLLWKNLGLNDQGIKIDIGDFQMDFTGGPGGYDFKLKDLDASLQVDGNGKVKPNGQYTVDIRITAKSSIDPQVKYVLGIIAKNTGHNQYRVRQNGKLPQHLMRRMF